jgi:hypothetical protein
MKFRFGIAGGFLAGMGLTLLAFRLLFFPSGEMAPVPRQGPGSGTERRVEELPQAPFAEPGSRGESETPMPAARSPRAAPEVPASAGQSPGQSALKHGILRGKVVYGADGAPVKGITVRLSREGYLHSECLTDDGGRFAMCTWEEGAWKVTAYPYGDRGFRPEKQVEVEDGSDDFIELVVPDRHEFEVSGCVKDSGGKGIPGVQVKVHAVGGAKLTEAETVTGEEGIFNLPALAVGLPCPSPRAPRSMIEFDGDSSWSRLRKLGERSGGPGLFFKLTHPEYKAKSERVGLSQAIDGRISLDLRLNSLGKGGGVSGTITTPGGESLDGWSLPYRIEGTGKAGEKEGGGQFPFGTDASGSGMPGVKSAAKIKGGRFTIKVETEGRLILGGFVGRYWIVDDMDFGEVDRETRKGGVVVQARALPVHTITLLDQNGVPLGETVEGIWGLVWGGKGPKGPCSGFVEVKSGKILVPVYFSDARTLKVWGTGFIEKSLEIHPDRLPETIRIHLLPPLLVGKVEFPPGFADWEEVEIHVKSEYAGGGHGGSGQWTGFDRKTGEFEIKRFSKEGPNTVYRVMISIPGHKPWVKDNIRPKKGKPPERVVVTFHE